MHYIFGSWFDPFTHAHEEIIKTIHKKLRQNDKFHILVTDNDEKKNRTSVEERCNMVRNALAARNIKKYELYKQNNRMYEFISVNFRTVDPKDITIVIGEDEWASLLADKWKFSKRLLKYYKFIIFTRKGSEKDWQKKYTTDSYDYTFMELSDKVQDVSSSYVRQAFEMDPECHYKLVQDHISKNVFHYIKEHSLYHQNPLDYDKIEKAFIENYKKQGWGKFANTVDNVPICGDEVLLIRRKKPPFQNYWCCCGGFFDPIDIVDKETGKNVKADEDLEHAAARELREETHLDIPVHKFKQIRTYSHMFDPRLRIIDTAFLVHVTGKEKKLAFAGDDAADTRWFKLDNLPKMGFHHEMIIKDALEKMDNE